MTKIINGGVIANFILDFRIMKTLKEWNILIFKFILLLIACQLNAQNQVLTRQNGEVSWQSNPSTLSPGGIANVRADLPISVSIPSMTATTVVFSSEDYGLNNTYDPTTGIFTPPQAGYYVIKASVNWSNTNTTFGERRVRLCKNGTSSVVYQNSEDGGGSMHSSIHTVIYSDGTDNYSVVVWQNSGSNHLISGSMLPGGGTIFTAFNLSLLNQEILKKKSDGVSWENQ